MSDLIGLSAVLLIAATLGFFAAFILWVLAALTVLFIILCLWAAFSGERDTRNPAREDRAA